MVYESAQRNIERAQQRAFIASEHAQRGLSVVRAQEDPVGAYRASVYTSARSELDRMNGVGSHAEAHLSVAESSLSVGIELLATARELVVQGGNDTYTRADRASIALEIREIRAQLLALSNTEFDGAHIFAGSLTNAAPFDTAGTYLGDSYVRRVEIAPGQWTDMNVPGGDIFAPTAGQNVFVALDAVITALQADDGAAVRASLASMDALEQQLIDGRTRVGLSRTSLIAATDSRAALDEDLAGAHAIAVELDPAVGFVRLNEAQTALQAAIAQAAKILEQLALPGVP